MSISIVNGYVCTSGCEAAKARRGEDPRQSAIGMESGKARDAQDVASKPGEAVVILGGALAGVRALTQTSASDGVRARLLDVQV